MGRGATKAMSNVFYEARKNASKFNEKLGSRAGAAEMLNVSEDVIKDIELDRYVRMPAEYVVGMAELYKAPQLLPFYCLNQCPVGCHMPLSDRVLTLEEVAVRFLKDVSDIEDIKEKVLEIAYDGQIGDEEKVDLKMVVNKIDALAKTLCELKVLCEKEL